MYGLPIIQIGLDLRAELSALAKKAAIPWYMNPDDLGGLCGIGSYTMARILRALGLRTEYRFTSYGPWAGGHCWLVVKGSEIVIDVTATQFSRRRGGDSMVYPDVVLDSAHRYPAIYGLANEVPNMMRQFEVTRYLRSWNMQSPHKYWKDELRAIYRKLVAKYALKKAIHEHSYRPVLAAA